MQSSDEKGPQELDFFQKISWPHVTRLAIFGPSRTDFKTKKMDASYTRLADGKARNKEDEEYSHQTDPKLNILNVQDRRLAQAKSRHAGRLCYLPCLVSGKEERISRGLAMEEQCAHVPFDPTRFDDELLVILAQFGSHAAERELMSRYYQMVKDKITFLARKMKLPRQEVLDAQEQSLIWFHEAIRRYKNRPQSGQRLRTFRPLVNWLLEKRFITYLKRYRWRQRHFNGSEKAARELEKATVPLTGSTLPIQSQEREDSGAPLPFEEEEFRRRLEEAVKQLRPELQDLWESLKAGRKLGWIAKDLGVSVRTIKRRKAELRVELQRRVGEFRQS